MNKELIKQRFKKRLNSYNDNARIQRQMAEKLINMISSESSNSKLSILEIGCGTGLLTELADKKFEYSNYTALDIVPECESFIKKINQNIEFISSDVEEYINKTDEKYDVIISNASLQWIESLPDFLNKLLEKLSPNGKLLFSTFGKENFREINYVLGKTLTYFSKSELEKILKKHLTQIEEEVRVMAFKTPKDVLKHIQSTGVNALSQEAWTKKDFISFENEYNSFCANRPTLTYNPIYILMQK